MKKRRGLIGLLVVLGLVTIACGPTAIAPTSTASSTGRPEAMVVPSQGEAAKRKVQVETTSPLTFIPDTIIVEPVENVDSSLPTRLGSPILLPSPPQMLRRRS